MLEQEKLRSAALNRGVKKSEVKVGGAATATDLPSSSMESSLVS